MQVSYREVLRCLLEGVQWLMDKAVALYLRTSRLDLDDYNHEVDEGLHITSMGGSWLAIVEGFGGKRIRDVRTGPDGAVYVLTDEKDGELLRLSPPHGVSP